MRIRWRIKGFKEIRRSEEVREQVRDLSDEILSRLPDGYDWTGMQAKSRYREIIFADSHSAFGDQIRNNSLQKVLFEMGGRM